MLVEQRHSKARAVVEVAVLVDSEEALPFDWEISLCGRTASGASIFADRHDRLTATLTIPDPELWWPAGQGAQTLHDLTVRIGDQTVTRRIGLRDIRLVTQKDKAGTGFKFRVNRRDIFAKGANWIPADALPGRITPDTSAPLLQSAVDANMNMIRVWGGGRYEPDWFYDLCDEMGLMVWQDFMFACALYPSTPDFLAEVAAEVRDTVTPPQPPRLPGALVRRQRAARRADLVRGMRRNRDRYLVAYDRLNRTIEATLKAVSPAANWWPSSPSPGPMTLRRRLARRQLGRHALLVGLARGPRLRPLPRRRAPVLLRIRLPVLSLDVRHRPLRRPGDWNIAAPVFESAPEERRRQCPHRGNHVPHFRFPVDFPNFVYLSQVQQALAIKTAVTHWRALKPHCMGTLYWQLNDTWPVCSWSSLDYGGNWKLLHHIARPASSPRSWSPPSPIPRRLSLVAINDHPAPIDLEVHRLGVRPTAIRPIHEETVQVAPERSLTIRPPYAQPYAQP